jgi:5-formyltetrahydrofolate cyclo-ligase
MTKEERREYMREWRAKNRDTIRAQRRDNARRKALEALQSAKQKNVSVYIIRTYTGGEYIVGGRTR